MGFRNSLALRIIFLEAEGILTTDGADGERRGF